MRSKSILCYEYDGSEFAGGNYHNILLIGYESNFKQEMNFVAGKGVIYGLVLYLRILIFYVSLVNVTRVGQNLGSGLHLYCLSFSWEAFIVYLSVQRSYC